VRGKRGFRLLPGEFAKGVFSGGKLFHYAVVIRVEGHMNKLFYY
jgi:hypothetical protein